ncbi:MAG: right-handed parallel beta-helix repeat-containing protein [Halobacteriales archaeon]|nr:right-handed parallel beta-helix repeat-containing protein [Halobacteriales archaeon]
MHDETHRRRDRAHEHWRADPVSRRSILAAGATAFGAALAGCASFGRRSTPGSDAVPHGVEGDADDSESETRQMASTRTASVQFVGSAPEQHDTIQAAVDAAVPGGRVSITQSYDPSLERWPVVSRKVLVVETDGLLPEIEVPAGSDGIVFETDNKRPPGPILRNLSLRGGARGIVFRGTKYPTLYNCHVTDCSGVSYAFEDTFEADGKTYRNGTNSVQLYSCTSLRAGEAGLKTDYMTHSIVLDTCRMIHSDGFGVHFDGPANCVIRGGQYENNADAGIFARVAESVTIRDAYIEENGLGDGHFPASVVAKKCRDLLIEGCYFNGLGTPYAIVLLGNSSSENPTIRSCRFKSHALANVLTDVEDTDVDRVAGNVDPDSSATRVRNYGTIVGPTGEGVNLQRTVGRDPGDRALSRGTPGVEDGSIGVWTRRGTWNLSGGESVTPRHR